MRCRSLLSILGLLSLFALPFLTATCAGSHAGLCPRTQPRRRLLPRRLRRRHPLLPRARRELRPHQDVQSRQVDPRRRIRDRRHLLARKPRASRRIQDRSRANWLTRAASPTHRPTTSPAPLRSSSTSTAACTPTRSPAASTPFSLPTSSSRRRATPKSTPSSNNVILVLWPTINPDGQNMVVSWYRRNLGTSFEVSPMPWLYQEYVGHDNNRDGYMLNMIESQVVTRTEIEYSPVIFYCQHQTAPFPARIWIPPFADPISSNISPYMRSWLNVVGTQMSAALQEQHLARSHLTGPIRQLVSRLPRLHPRLPQRDLLLHRDRPLPLRHAALLYRQRFPQALAGPESAHPLHRSLAGRMVASGRRREIHGRCFHVRARHLVRNTANSSSTTAGRPRTTTSSTSSTLRRSPTSCPIRRPTRPKPRSLRRSFSTTALKFTAPPAPSTPTASTIPPARGLS